MFSKNVPDYKRKEAEQLLADFHKNRNMNKYYLRVLYPSSVKYSGQYEDFEVIAEDVQITNQDCYMFVNYNDGDELVASYPIRFTIITKIEKHED